MAEKLLERMRRILRTGHYNYRTEQAYLDWAKRFIRFHDRRHPAEMGKAEVEAFLSHLAVDCNVAPATQNQALNGILFLYRRVPAPHDLIVSLLYGSGLRISEAMRLRVKDLDFQRRELIVRDGKGAKDRVTVLADSCIAALQLQVQKSLTIAELDEKQQRGGWPGIPAPG